MNVAEIIPGNQAFMPSKENASWQPYPCHHHRHLRKAINENLIKSGHHGDCCLCCAPEMQNMKQTLEASLSINAQAYPIMTQYAMKHLMRHQCRLLCRRRHEAASLRPLWRAAKALSPQHARGGFFVPHMGMKLLAITNSRNENLRQGGAPRAAV